MPALFWHALGGADSQPDCLRVFTLVDALVSGAISKALEGKVFEQNGGVTGAKLIVHELVKLAKTQWLLERTGRAGRSANQEGVELVDFGVGSLSCHALFNGVRQVKGLYQS